MFDLPQLIWLLLVIGAGWYALRRFNRLSARGSARGGAPPRSGARPRGPQGPPPRLEAEDLVACRVCGTYVAAGAPECGQRDCPRLR
jgi:hypothetical protein